MIGLTVEFPTDSSIYEIGIVTSYNEETGIVIITDEDGDKWRGYEYQVIVLDEII